MVDGPDAGKRRLGWRLLKGLVLIFGLVFGWFAVNRLISSWTVVRTLTLGDPDPFPAAGAVETLRVGSYNIAHGRGGRFGATSWEGGDRERKTARLREIARLLRDAQLEIVVLNEVDFSSIWSGHVDQARVIAEEAGFSYVVEQRNLDMAIPFASLRFGNAILSRYPITEATFLDFPNPSELLAALAGGEKEGVVATIALPDGRRMLVAAIHLCVTSEAIRVASAEMLLDVQRRSSLPMVIMGDFNTAPTGYPHHHEDVQGRNALDVLLESGRFATALPGLPIPRNRFTFPSEGPDRVIDWILASPEWTIRDVRGLPNPLSDHLPITAVLERTESRRR